MGPYCGYCDKRCFVRVQADDPFLVYYAARGLNIKASCYGGDWHERYEICEWLDAHVINRDQNPYISNFVWLGKAMRWGGE